VPKKTKSSDIDELQIISDLSVIFSSTSELKQTLQETILLVSKLTRADACFLYLLDNATNDLVLSASKTPHPGEVGHLRLKMGEGITGWVAKHHKTVVIPEEAHKDPRFVGSLAEDIFEAFLSVPILIKNTVVGVINVQHKKPHVYGQRLVHLMNTMGRQVGGAIETARLYEETKRRARTLDTLTAVSSTLAQDRYPEEIMHLIVNMTAQMMGSNICAIMLLDEKRKELKIVATQSLSAEYKDKPPVKVHGSMTGKAVLTKQPVIIKDVRKETSYQFRDVAVAQGLVSLLSVPMMVKDKVLGVLNSYTPTEHIFTHEEIAFAQSVANQCAAAIENTRLL